MAECIERKAAIKAIQRQRGPNNSVAQNRLLALAVHDVLQIAAADVAPVRHGRWVMSSDRPDTIICTCCDSAFDVWKADIKRHHYYPNCGAKMDGAE